MNSLLWFEPPPFAYLSIVRVCVFQPFAQLFPIRVQTLRLSQHVLSCGIRMESTANHGTRLQKVLESL